MGGGAGSGAGGYSSYDREYSAQSGYGMQQVEDYGQGFSDMGRTGGGFSSGRPGGMQQDQGAETGYDPMNVVQRIVRYVLGIFWFNTFYYIYTYEYIL